MPAPALGRSPWLRTALARISHQPTVATVHLPKSTALHSEKVLDVLSSTPSRFVPRAPCISGYLHALAARPGEKCGLEAWCRLEIQLPTALKAPTIVRADGRTPLVHQLKAAIGAKLPPVFSLNRGHFP
jgi:hypothetical protein